MKRLLPLCAALALSCSPAVRSLAPSPGDAAHRAGELLGALASRFGPIERSPRFDEVRPRLLRASLVPSRVYDDRRIWTQWEPSRRGLVFSGSRTTAAYAIDIADRTPRRPADYRGRLVLVGEGDSAFEWRLREDLGVGGITLTGLAAAADSLLRVPETASEGERAHELREALPRTALALGRLVHLRSVLVSREGGVTAVRAVAEVDPASLPPDFRGYARYLERYAPDTELNVAARDDLGLFWELDLRQQRFTLRFAVRDGRLAPLEGAPRPLPDRFRVSVAFAMRSGRFVIGYDDLEAFVALSAQDDSAGFHARFRREPQWRLPPLAGPLLRSPLRQPFEGEGSELSMRFEEAPGTNLLVRDYRLRVRENWVLRWLGGRVGTAVDEFRNEAEYQSDRFTAEALLALREDVVAVLAGS